MESIRNLRKVSLILFAIFLTAAFLTGCGYKPSAHYAKEKIQGKVYVDVDVDIEDPKNSVLVKDALNEIVVSRFDRQLVTKRSEADTVLIVKLNSVSMSELQKDEDGYVNLYRANVNITVKYNGPGGEGSVGVSGSYDFSVDDGSTISDAKRFEAIKVASNKALEEIVSKFAIESFRKEDMPKDEDKDTQIDGNFKISK